MHITAQHCVSKIGIVLFYRSKFFQKDFGSLIYFFDFFSTSINFMVFHDDFQYEIHEEVPDYTYEKLLSDLGGAAGLFLGCR